MRKIILHGGVGSNLDLSTILDKYASLSLNYADPLDAVVAAVKYLEDDLNFNAGTGSVMRLDGTIQMDASVMLKENFGSVINIEFVKNPVQVAREVMEKSPHVILAGDGATKFARAMGHPFYDPTTEKSMKRLVEARKEALTNPKFKIPGIQIIDTVGAVADYDGRVAAALSTGGSVPMLRGRVGDTPIPGAGIYVGDNFGIAATGTGEEILRKSLSFSMFNNRGNMEKYWNETFEISEFPLGIVGFNEGKKFTFANRQMAVGYSEKQ